MTDSPPPYIRRLRKRDLGDASSGSGKSTWMESEKPAAGKRPPLQAVAAVKKCLKKLNVAHLCGIHTIQVSHKKYNASVPKQHVHVTCKYDQVRPTC